MEAERGDESGGETDTTVVTLKQWQVDGGPHGLRDLPAGVADDADDFVVFWADIASTEMAANGVFAGEVLLRGGFADDGDLAMIEALVVTEVAAVDERDLERGKVAGVED